MTQRSMLAGLTPTVNVRAGGDVRVRGWDSDRVQASTESRWGLKLERKSQTEIARVRAKVGERVLLDVRVDPLATLRKEASAEAIEVQLAGSGEVMVPRGSVVKVHSGKNAEVSGLAGSLTVYAGRDGVIRKVQTLAHAAAGGTLDFEVEQIAPETTKFEAGRNLRCYIRDLRDARVAVNDLGGEWEGVIGAGTRKLLLKAGGDVTLVTAEAVEAQPPEYVLGKVERPEGG